jgi:Domain of unknown function (DUF4340)
MTWRRVGVIYVVLAILTLVVTVIDGARLPSAEQNTHLPVGPSLIDADAASITAVTFRKEGRIVRAIRQPQRWRTVEPAKAPISPDLIEATIATLTTGQAAEKLTQVPDSELAAYGLDAPTALVEVVIGNAAASPVTVALGSRNPTRTAVYARRGDQPTIFLVGMNVSYYIDLIFDAAKS